MVKGTDLAKVQFSYNDNGKNVTRNMYVQHGITIDFSGDGKAENGKYHIGADGAVYNDKGDKIDVIQTTREQMAALEGMSMAAEESGSNPVKGKFILTDADINAAMSDEGGYNSSLHVNMRQNALGGNKKTHYRDGQWDTGANMNNGRYDTKLTGDGDPSFVSVSSDRTEAKAKQYQEQRWAEEHPILNGIKKGWNYITSFFD